MEDGMRIQYYIFRKKLLLINFYRKKEMSYEDIAYVLSRHTKIIKTYCTTLLYDA
ncbi:hypothetical protein SAMN02745191_0048 [Anaerorhabdus furcosa]|uniref:Uncharacterized protein n=1 Tax=Anaerorhabdus furcosa TaxID=118967 RepID=A0A1T4QKI8_9FIRM|nr:hypothetical protein SAMN02745191_0048 [Anaerorhabdus furcosa]